MEDRIKQEVLNEIDTWEGIEQDKRLRLINVDTFERAIDLTIKKCNDEWTEFINKNKFTKKDEEELRADERAKVREEFEKETKPKVMIQNEVVQEMLMEEQQKIIGIIKKIKDKVPECQEGSLYNMLRILIDKLNDDSIIIEYDKSGFGVTSIKPVLNEIGDKSI